MTQIKKFFFALLLALTPVLTFGQYIGESEEDAFSRAGVAITAYIDSVQRDVFAAAQREAGARNRRDEAREQTAAAKRRVDTAEREHTSALSAFRANPQSLNARRNVEEAESRTEEAGAELAAAQSHERSAQNAWAAAQADLNRARTLLSQLQKTSQDLLAKKITPQEVFAQTPDRLIPPPKVAPAPPPTEEIPEIPETSEVLETAETVERTEDIPTAFIVFGEETPPAQIDEGVGAKRFLLSLRTEISAGLVKNTLSSVGGIFEIGAILENGVYLTGDLSGGAFYAGGGVNFGYCFNRHGVLNVISGASAGYYRTALKTEFIRESEKLILAEARGRNVSGAGVFVKLLGNGAANFDLTYKIMFGHNKIPVSYSSRDGVVYESGFDAIRPRQTFAIGYVIMRRASQKSAQGGN